MPLQLDALVQNQVQVACRMHTHQLLAGAGMGQSVLRLCVTQNKAVACWVGSCAPISMNQAGTSSHSACKSS